MGVIPMLGLAAGVAGQEPRTTGAEPDRVELALDVDPEHRDDPALARALLTPEDPLVARITIDAAVATSWLMTGPGVVLERQVGTGWELRTRWDGMGRATFRDELPRGEGAVSYRICVQAGSDRHCSDPISVQLPSR